MNQLNTFRLVDAYKRLCASQFKGARSQSKAMLEYDVIRNEQAPEVLEHFGRLFSIDPAASGAELLAESY